jgi:hypothetical protein
MAGAGVAWVADEVIATAPAVTTSMVRKMVMIFFFMTPPFN